MLSIVTTPGAARDRQPRPRRIRSSFPTLAPSMARVVQTTAPDSRFWTNLVLQPLPGGRYFRIIEPVVYRSKRLGEDVVVPAGFVTNFASVPKFLWWFISPLEGHLPAAVVHDYLYASGIVSRRVADAIFLDAMKELNVAGWKRTAMWAAVRVGGWVVHNPPTATA